MILMHMLSRAYWREMMNNVKLNIATLLKTLTSWRESGALTHGRYYELAKNTECQHPLLCFKLKVSAFWFFGDNFLCQGIRYFLVSPFIQME